MKNCTGHEPKNEIRGLLTFARHDCGTELAVLVVRCGREAALGDNQLILCCGEACRCRKRPSFPDMVDVMRWLSSTESRVTVADCTGAPVTCVQHGAGDVVEA